MVFHVGVDSLLTKFYVYNTNNRELHFLTDDTTFETEWIKHKFENIKSNISGEYGCLCICSNSNDTNDIRKDLIKYAVHCGFQRVEIIDESTALYFSALSGSSYQPVEKDLIYVMYNKECYIWQKKESGTKLLNVVDEKNYVNMSNWFLYKGASVDAYILLHHKNFNIENFLLNDYIKYFQYFIYTFESLAKGAITKALIMADNSLTDISDTSTFLHRAFEIYLGKNQVSSIDFYQKLPLQKSFELKKFATKRLLYVISYSPNGIKRIDEAIFLPPDEKFMCTFKIDKNGIFYVYLKKLLFFTGLLQNPHISQMCYSLKSANPESLNKVYPIKTIFDLEFHKPSDVVGVDLGSTRSFAAVVRINGPETIVLGNSDNERHMPSYVSFDEKNAKCGKIVVHRLRNYSESTVFDCNKIIGKEYHDIKIDNRWPFEIVNHNDYIQIEVEDCGKKTLKYPEEIFAVLLKYIKQKATEFQGIELHEVVISYPLMLTKSVKDAIYISAILAGWKIIHLIPDAYAALLSYNALAYLEELNNDTHILIFDMGGSNFNVSIYILSNETLMTFEIGDIGGRDFDNTLFDYFKEKLFTNFKISFDKGTIHEKKFYKLLSACEEIKIVLSNEKEAMLDVDMFDSSSSEFISITREEFETMSAGLITKIKEHFCKNLGCDNFSVIQNIFLLGGGSRMPMIQRLIKETFQNATIVNTVNPEETFALGAAACAEMIAYARETEKSEPETILCQNKFS